MLIERARESAATARRRAPRSGFTLIELLVVVAIISTLMGLVVAVSAKVRKNTQIAATKALLEGISSGLNRFYSEFGVYPPSNTDDIPSDTVEKDSLYFYLCTSDRTKIEQKLFPTQQPTGKPLVAFLDPPAEYLVKDGDTTLIVDPWGSQIMYVNCRQYTDSKSVDGYGNPIYKADDGLCHNPSSFDLYSLGPNRIKDPDPLNPIDDITNWAVKQQ